MHFVQDARHIADHTLLVTFEDGSEKYVDLGPHLDGEIFEPLKDVEYFKTVRVDRELDTVVWNNGADFSPDFLYEIGQAATGARSAG